MKLKQLIGMMMCCMIIAGCGAKGNVDTNVKVDTNIKVDTNVDVDTDVKTDTDVKVDSDTDVKVDADVKVDTDVKVSADAPVRVGGMKGPTSMGLMFLKDKNEMGQASDTYEFTMVKAADELLPLMVKGELDIALVPANVASVLYNKTNGGVQVIDINTLGVLYMVSGVTSVAAPADLKGKTIYLTGKGTTPDYVLQYVLKENGIAMDDVTLEYKSEATEVAAVLAENPDAIGLLPQPFVTVACAQNEALKVVMDMNAEWENVQGADGSKMVTGVTVVRKDFLQNNEEAVKLFLQEHKDSTVAINENVATGAKLVVDAGIVGKVPVAEKAIPKCNIVCITGEEMKQALKGYLEILFEQNNQSVGGALPGDDFYYVEK